MGWMHFIVIQYVIRDSLKSIQVQVHDLPSDRDNTCALQKANWLLLSYTYETSLLKYAHQSFYQIAPAQISKLFSVKGTMLNSRQTKQLVLNRPEKEIARLFLRHRGTSIWNAVPSSVKDYTILHSKTT